jgi:hypothetical protein
MSDSLTHEQALAKAIIDSVLIRKRSFDTRAHSEAVLKAGNRWSVAREKFYKKSITEACAEGCKGTDFYYPVHAILSCGDAGVLEWARVLILSLPQSPYLKGDDNDK